MRTQTFIRDGWSFRPGAYHPSGVRYWNLRRKGDRESLHSGSTAHLTECSDGASWLVSADRYPCDARPSFERACQLAIAMAERRDRSTFAAI